MFSFPSFYRPVLLLLSLLCGQAFASAQVAPVIERATDNPYLSYFNPALIKPDPRVLSTDVCIYGGSSAGVIAAVQLHRMGKRAIILEPTGHLGGLSSGGLSFTDIGNKKAIGGLSHNFYQRLGRKYGKPEEWRFEPHVAEQVFNELIAESGTPVHFYEFVRSLQKERGRITQMTTMSGLTIRAKMFIDATYEGDLMALAGVAYRTGRESNSTYGETFNGVQLRDKHQFEFAIDPYVIVGDPTSGLLPGVFADEPQALGDGDYAIQAYNFRLCLTNDPEKRMPFPRPRNYDPGQYALLARYLATGWSKVLGGFGPLVNKKVDLNNNGAISTDYIWGSHEYPGGHYLNRERIFQDHVSYQQGLLYFLCNDPQVPQGIRERVSPWGLARDEFVETDGWPHQLYIREARRMVSAYVMTEHNVRGTRVVEDPVSLAAYTMDSHNTRRFVRDGRLWNEGDVQVGGFPPYPISYRSIIARKSDCENLLVPICLSTSHIAYGSIRMEPVFMILGQSAATAAALAIDSDSALQDISYPALKARLEQDGQVLAWVK